jgi:FMN reductase
MPTYKKIHVVGLGGTLRQNSTSLWALERALAAAQEAGASVELLPLRELDLPFYVPGKALGDYGANVQDFIERVSKADALLISSAGYHGTLAGGTKNALDFFEFLRDREPPYLQERVVGLIATAGGDMANVHTVDTMTHIVYSWRGIVAPLQVAIPHSWQVFDKDGTIRVEKWGERLDMLGKLVVDMATRWKLRGKLCPCGLTCKWPKR